MRALRGLLSIALVPVLLAGCATEVTMPGPHSQPKPLTDGDRDGVIDARDKCQQTPVGAKVNNDGCSEIVSEPMQVEVIINFPHNSSHIPPTDETPVAALAAYLQRLPDVHARLDGHASPVGDDKLNDRLSLKRAQAVRDMLVTRYQIAPERIELGAHGAHQPVVPGVDALSQKANRRVEAQAPGLIHSADIMRWTIYTPGR